MLARLAVAVLLVATLLAVAEPAGADHTITWGAGESCEAASKTAATTVNTPVRFIACVTLGGEPLPEHPMDVLVEGPTRSAETNVVTDAAGIAEWAVQPTVEGQTRVSLCDADGCLYGATVITVTAAPTATVAPTTTTLVATTTTATPTTTTTTVTTEESSSDSDGFPWLFVVFAVLLILVLIAVLLRRFFGGPGGVGLAGSDDDDGPRDEPPPVIYGEERDEGRYIPLVFVPGVMASSLVGRDADGKIQKYWPPVGFDGDVRRCLEGLQTASSADFRVGEASELGLLSGIHSKLIQFLNDHGYSTVEDNKNLYIYSYNWMRSCDENGKGLARLLARIKDKHRRPAHVIVHSLGGLVLRSAWHIHGSRDVDQVAYLASPHYGSPMAYYALHPNIPYSFMDGMVGPAINAAYSTNVRANAGGTDGLPAAVHALTVAAAGDRLFDQTLKQVALNCGGVVELLPDHLYFRDANPKFPMAVYDYAASSPPTLAEDAREWTERIAPASWEEQYLTAPWLSLPKSMHERVREAMAFKRKIDGPLPPGDGTKTLIVYGIHQPTQTEIELFVEDPNDDATPPDVSGRPNKQGGDGTVARISGQGKLLWAGSPRVEVENSVAHFRMTEVAAVHQMLREFFPFGGNPGAFGVAPAAPAGAGNR